MMMKEHPEVEQFFCIIDYAALPPKHKNNLTDILISLVAYMIFITEISILMIYDPPLDKTSFIVFIILPSVFHLIPIFGNFTFNSANEGS